MIPREDGVFIVSRLAALYLLMWAMMEITYIPAAFMALLHSMHNAEGDRSAIYWIHYHQVFGVSLSIRVLVLTISSAVLWKCGPIVQRFFAQPKPVLISAERAD